VVCAYNNYLNILNPNLMKNFIAYLVVFFTFFAAPSLVSAQNTSIIVQFKKGVTDDVINDVRKTYEIRYGLFENENNEQDRRFRTCDGQITYCLWYFQSRRDSVDVIGVIRNEGQVENSAFNNYTESSSSLPPTDNRELAPYPYLLSDLRDAVNGPDCEVKTGTARRTMQIVDSGLGDGGQTLGGLPLFGRNIVMGHNYINPTLSPIDDLGHGTHITGISTMMVTRHHANELVEIGVSRVINNTGRGRLFDIIHALADNMCEKNVFNFSFAYKVPRALNPEPNDVLTDLMQYAG
jgi:hypothetical protein